MVAAIVGLSAIVDKHHVDDLMMKWSQHDLNKNYFWLISFSDLLGVIFGSDGHHSACSQPLAIV